VLVRTSRLFSTSVDALIRESSAPLSVDSVMLRFDQALGVLILEVDGAAVAES
jgi:hypothetical protein